MKAHGHLAQLTLFFLGDRRGANFHCTALLVLGLIVEILTLGDDLHAGKIGIPQHCHVDLAAVDLLLHHHMTAEVEQLAECLIQFFLRIGQGNADGAAAVDHLHGAGNFQLLHQGGDVRFGIVHIVPRGGTDAEGVHHALGDGLIHSHAAAEIVRTCVGHAQQVEGSLNAAIFTVSAVHGEEHNVCHATDRQHILADDGRTLILAGSADSLQIGGHRLDGGVAQQSIGGIENGGEVALIVLKTHEHIHKNSLVTLLAEGAAHAAAADEAHMALGTETTG